MMTTSLELSIVEILQIYVKIYIKIHSVANANTQCLQVLKTRIIHLLVLYVFFRSFPAQFHLYSIKKRSSNISVGVQLNGLLVKIQQCLVLFKIWCTVYFHPLCVVLFCIIILIRPCKTQPIDVCTESDYVIHPASLRATCATIS